MFRAEQFVEEGKAVIVSGRVRFYPPDQHPGYHTGSVILRWRGKMSGGFNVMQCEIC